MIRVSQELMTFRLGKYYLVETKTIDGFVLDDIPIEADLSYIDQNTKVVFRRNGCDK